MARAIWSGAVGFGLVSVPIKLYSATEDKEVRFHEFKEGTKRRIRHKRVTEGTEEEVPYEDVAKGYEVSKGKFVTLTQEELASVEPNRTRTIEIEDFVDLEDIDPVYYKKTYYVVPGDMEGADRPYLLLHAAMKKKGKVGIGRFVFRTKQHLVAVRPMDRVLALNTMFFHDEVRSANDLENVPRQRKLPVRELSIAEQLIEAQTVEWDPSRYKDTYRARVLRLIRDKAKGKEISGEREEAEPEGVADLMEALRASVEAAKKGKRTPQRRRRASPTGRKGRRKAA